MPKQYPPILYTDGPVPILPRNNTASDYPVQVRRVCEVYSQGLYFEVGDYAWLS
jgi:hypothetical protein